MKPSGTTLNTRESNPAPTWLALAIIILAGLLAYSNNYHGEFIFDDYDSIVNNPVIKKLSPLTDILWSGPEAPNTPLSGRPVPTVSLALNHAVNGLDVWGYHLVNNVIHILAALALFGLIRTTLLLPQFAPRLKNDCTGYSLAIVLLWLVHPLHTESVNYITQRTETLMGLFFLLTLFFAAKGFQSARPNIWLLAAVVVCALGMGSKEVMVLAPIIVLLYDYFFVAGSFKTAFSRRRGFYAVLFSTWLVFAFFYSGSSRSETVNFTVPGIGIWNYFLTQFTVILHYLRLSVWPQPLAFDYLDWPIASEFSTVIMPAAILGAMAASTIWGFKHKAWWAFPGIWFFLILAPTSSFLPIPTEIIAERRMYLPLAAIILLIVFLLDALWVKISAGKSLSKKSLKILPTVLVVILTAGLGQATWNRNKDYRTDISIWSDTIKKRPYNYRAYNNLGESYLRKGKLPEAVENFRTAIRLKSDMPLFYSNIGAALSDLGQTTEAISMLQKGLELNPGDSLVHYNIAIAYQRIKDLDNAAHHFHQSISLNPDLTLAYGNLGLLLMQQGDLDGAEKNLGTLVKKTPDSAEAYGALARLRVQQGRTDEAIDLYRQALRLDPNANHIAARLNAILTTYPPKR